MSRPGCFPAPSLLPLPAAQPSGEEVRKATGPLLRGWSGGTGELGWAWQRGPQSWYRAWWSRTRGSLARRRMLHLARGVVPLVLRRPLGVVPYILQRPLGVLPPHYYVENMVGGSHIPLQAVSSGRWDTVPGG